MASWTWTKPSASTLAAALALLTTAVAPVRADPGAQEAIDCVSLRLAVDNDPGLYELYKDARSRWKPEHFTHPRFHDPAEYRYLVHWVTFHRWQEFRADPQGKLQSEHFGVTLFTNRNPFPFMRSQLGYILKVPESNIWGASTHDLTELNGHQLGWRHDDPASVSVYLRRVLREVGIKHPEEILSFQGLRKYPWNEVTVQGTGDAGRKVEITGIVYMVLDAHVDLSKPIPGQIRANQPTLAELLETQSRQLGVPIVPIRAR